MHPLALAESGWVWVGAGSRPAGLRTGRAIPGLRRDAALPVRQNTRQGREGGALPKALGRSVHKASSPSRRVRLALDVGLFPERRTMPGFGNRIFGRETVLQRFVMGGGAALAEPASS